METELDDCVFGKIVRREIPADIVYEDEHALAFLDKAPNMLGHTLVIPKRHFKNIFDVDESTLAGVMEAVRKVAPAVRDAVDAKGVHISSNHEAAAGQVVFHLHFHILPRHDRSEFVFWPLLEDYTPELATSTAEKIREKLS